MPARRSSDFGLVIEAVEVVLCIGKKMQGKKMQKRRRSSGGDILAIHFFAKSGTASWRCDQEGAGVGGRDLGR